MGGMHGGSWGSMLSERPDSLTKLDRHTVLRILRYARPYTGHIIGMLVVWS